MPMSLLSRVRLGICITVVIMFWLSGRANERKQQLANLTKALERKAALGALPARHGGGGPMLDTGALMGGQQMGFGQHAGTPLVPGADLLFGPPAVAHLPPAPPPALNLPAGFGSQGMPPDPNVAPVPPPLPAAAHLPPIPVAPAGPPAFPAFRAAHRDSNREGGLPRVNDMPLPPAPGPILPPAPFDPAAFQAAAELPIRHAFIEEDTPLFTGFDEDEEEEEMVEALGGFSGLGDNGIIGGLQGLPDVGETPAEHEGALTDDAGSEAKANDPETDRGESTAAGDAGLSYATMMKTLQRWRPYNRRKSAAPRNRKLFHTFRNKPTDAAPSWASWRSLNPDYARELLGDDVRDNMVRHIAADRAELAFLRDVYEKLPSTVLQLDYLKYLAVFNEGGVYADIDTHAHRPVDDWYRACADEDIGSARQDTFFGDETQSPDARDQSVQARKKIKGAARDTYLDHDRPLGKASRARGSGPGAGGRSKREPGLIVGIELDLSSDDGSASIDGRALYLAQYAFAATKGHPVLAAVLARIGERVDAKVANWSFEVAAAAAGTGQPVDGLSADGALAKRAAPPSMGDDAIKAAEELNPAALVAAAEAVAEREPVSIPAPPSKPALAKLRHMERITISPSKVHEWTGRGVWTDIVLGYLTHIDPSFDAVNLHNLRKPLRVGDVCILPTASFGAGQHNTGAKSPDPFDPAVMDMVFLRHFFAGAWKPL